MIHIDGHAILALIVIPTFSVWAIGYANYRRARRSVR